MPNVVNQSEAQAQATLQNAGFNVQVVDQQSNQPDGTVLAQSPVANNKAKKGSTVTITVARSNVQSPPRANDPQAVVPAPNTGSDGGVVTRTSNQQLECLRIATAQALTAPRLLRPKLRQQLR